MRIVRNDTPYDMRVLRRLICAVYQLLKKKEGPGRWWRTLRVTVTHAHADCRSFGSAYLDGWAMHLRLNRVGQKLYADSNKPLVRTEHPTAHAADTIAHELMHCWGYRHGQFVEGAWTRDPGWGPLQARFPLQLPLLAAKPRAPVDLTAQRYARLVERERQWQSKLKRAQSALRKLRVQKRGYERRLAARQPPQEKGSV